MSSDQKARNTKQLRFSSNQTELSDDPSRVWIVRKGGLQVESTRIADGAAVGLRRYLFPVTQNQALFGAETFPEFDHLGLMVIVKGDTEVLEMSFDDAISDLLDGVPGSHYLETWLAAVNQQIVQDAERLAPTIRVTEIEQYTLSKQDVVCPEFNTMALIRVVAGEIAVVGHQDYKLTPEDGWLLAGPDLWVQVTSDAADIATRPLSKTRDVNYVREGLALLHRLLYRRLVAQSRAEDEAELDRRKASGRLRDIETAQAFQDLGSVLDPLERFPRRETPLLTSLAVVGQVLGIEILAPAASEDLTRVNDPIEAIARSSHIHYRKVTLGAEWWLSDCGPLVGFIGEDGQHPVALLPAKGMYDYVDPNLRYRKPLTEDMRSRLDASAYMLYRPLPLKLKGVGSLLKFTARGRVRDALVVIVCGICAALLGMITPKVTGTLIDEAIPNAHMRLLYELGGILLVTGIATTLFTYVQVMTTVRVSTVAEFLSQSSMWGRLISFRPNFFRKYSSGDLQMRVNAVGEVSRELNGATMRPLVSGLMALLNFFLLWYYSWTLAKIGIYIGIIVLLLTAVVSYFISKSSYLLQELQGSFHGLMVQMVGGVGKLRVAGAEHRAFNHWVSEYSPQLRLMNKIQRLKDLVSIFNVNLPTVALAVLFWKAANLTSGLKITDPNYISIGDFIAFNTAFTLYLTGWTDVSDTFVGVFDSILKGRRIKPILDAQPEVPADAVDPGRLKGSIRFENVSFKYSDSGPQILDDVSFEVNPGEFVAFVGPSGSGKSTILRLLLGFESTTTGRILFDGQDLRGLDVLAVRRQIGTVIQGGRLNAGSIIENVANNAKLTHGEIWDAIASAGLNADVEKMPMGLHTIVAEGGVNFSGGQRQRLLVARALATRPRIVFFDEATSALDNKTQAVVTETLERRKVTRIMIAHRLSTIRNADRIYVIDHGRVVQQGNFEELSQQPGLFKDLTSRQMA